MGVGCHGGGEGRVLTGIDTARVTRGEGLTGATGGKGSTDATGGERATRDTGDAGGVGTEGTGVGRPAGPVAGRGGR